VYPIQWFPDPIRWQNYTELFAQVPVFLYTRNTLIITFFNTIGTLFSASLGGYAFARLRFKGRDTIFSILLATVMVPFAVTMIPVYVMFSKIGWVGTFLPLIVPPFFGAPINTFMLRQFFRTIPMDLEDAARIDGCSRLRTLFQIIMPISAPGLVSTALFVFLLAWDEFFFALIFTSTVAAKTVPVAIAEFTGRYVVDVTGMMTGGVLAAIPPVILALIFQRYIVSGLTAGAVKGEAARRKSLIDFMPGDLPGIGDLYGDKP